MKITRKKSNVSEAEQKALMKSNKFKTWKLSLDHLTFEFHSVMIESVMMFGSKLGFAMLNVDCVNRRTKTKPPGIVFLRGHSVCILTLLKCEEQLHMVLTHQPRVAIGGMMLEIPAGMMDEKHHFSGVAARELKEETGILLKQDDLTYLGYFYPSPGACDERIICYSVVVEKTVKEMKEMEEKMYGNEKEHEEIHLMIVPFNMKNVIETRDAKAMTCALMYHQQHHSLATASVSH